jgi:RNA polymerase sigma-70 factor (ECF subfamily)
MNAVVAAPDSRHLAEPESGDERVDLERYRAELVRYCRTKLGSAVDAEDAAQDTLIRAWRRVDGFEGRSPLRSWLYSIATNVCIDMLRARQRQADPVALEGAGSSVLDRTAAGKGSVAGVGPGEDDPADEIVRRDRVSRAFAHMLRFLPPRQRAVLFLRDVLHWRAHEVAELLGTTPAAVNSGLQRARATLAADPPARPRGRTSTSEGQGPAATPYVEAFAAYDVEVLVGLFRETATMSPGVPRGRNSTFVGSSPAIDHGAGERVLRQPRTLLKSCGH